MMASGTGCERIGTCEINIEPRVLSSSITCQFLPEKHYVTYSNGTDEDEKDRRWELRQEDSRLKLKGAKQKRLMLDHPPTMTRFRWPFS